MDLLEAFCSQLLKEGRIVFERRPVPPVNPPAGAVAVLERAFRAEHLGIAGDPIGFEPRLALEAAEVVRQASWAVICHDEPVEELAKRLSMPRPPKTAAQHFSADLMLRYLPQVHRRAKALRPEDPLVRLLEEVLRQWPLSGVLADVRERPTGPLDFGGHEGLMLLYAERLARHEKALWVPEGRAGEYAALVYQELGRELPPAPVETASDA